MLFMVKIVVRLPGDWQKERLHNLVQAETARGVQLMKEGKLHRIYRIVGQRANFSIWEAASGEELHATLSSLPMHAYMEVEVHPIIKHPTTEAWEAASQAIPPAS